MTPEQKDRLDGLANKASQTDDVSDWTALNDYVDSLIAAAVAAAYEDAAKICDNKFADERDAGDVDADFPANAWTYICAAAIRARKGAL